MIIEIKLLNIAFFPHVFVYSLITFYTHNVLVVWFVSAIISCYIIFPIIFFIYKNNRRYFNILLYLSLTIPIILSFMFYILKLKVPVSNDIFFVRIPVFLFGVICANAIIEHSSLSIIRKKKLYIYLIFVIILLFVNNLFNPHKTLLLTRWLFNFCTPLLLIKIGYFLDSVISKHKYINCILCKLGEITLELYLLHEFSLYVIIKNMNIYVSKNICNICSIIIAVFFSLIINIIVKKIKIYLNIIKL